MWPRHPRAEGQADLVLADVRSEGHRSDRPSSPYPSDLAPVPQAEAMTQWKPDLRISHARALAEPEWLDDLECHDLVRWDGRCQQLMHLTE